MQAFRTRLEDQPDKFLKIVKKAEQETGIPVTGREYYRKKSCPKPKNRSILQFKKYAGLCGKTGGRFAVSAGTGLYGAADASVAAAAVSVLPKPHGLIFVIAGSVGQRKAKSEPPVIGSDKMSGKSPFIC